MNNFLATKGVSRGDRTRRQLIEAALETLKQEGFAGATSRAIARIGGFNQALIFYHFGGVEPLLLAALDVTSEERMRRYREGLDEVESLEELLAFARQIYEEDRASGHMTVVSQIVAGSLARPELAPEVLARMEPWIDFAEESFVKVLRGTPLEGVLPTKELAYAVVTFYLGVNLLTALDPERRQPERLLERAAELAPVAARLLERQ